MVERNEGKDKNKQDVEEPVGKAQGGADSSGAGNILAGVQPEDASEGGAKRRKDD